MDASIVFIIVLSALPRMPTGNTNKLGYDSFHMFIPLLLQ
jgi:hypothetical protein